MLAVAWVLPRVVAAVSAVAWVVAWVALAGSAVARVLAGVVAASLVDDFYFLPAERWNGSIVTHIFYSNLKRYSEVIILTGKRPLLFAFFFTQNFPFIFPKTFKFYLLPSFRFLRDVPANSYKICCQWNLWKNVRRSFFFMDERNLNGKISPRYRGIAFINAFLKATYG